jgi:gamma-glutamyltranspeptidase
MEEFPLRTTGRWASGGAVVSPHYLASEAGAEILRDGGTAADAVIAANAVLGVVYPHMCGIGGDGFVLIDPGDGADIECLNASGWSSSRADAQRLRNSGLETMPIRGGLSVTVPGIVDGWQKLRDRFGQLEFSRLVAPAIRFATEGFPATSRLVAWMSGAKDVLQRDPWFRVRFLIGGEIPREGHVIRVPELARTLQVLEREGLRSFYEGDLANDIARSIQASGGDISAEDLADYSAEWVAPITLDTGNYAIHVPPPNSQGVTLLWMLQEAFDGQLLDAASATRSLVRAKKVAFELRDSLITDPMFMEQAPLTLLDAPRHHQTVRRSSVPPTQGGTVFLAAWDQSGMLVSMIQSIYYEFGSGVVVPGWGVILQNRGAYFSLDESSPNILRPRKRSLHTLMCSVIHERVRGERVALGTMGGDGQPQVLAQMVTHWLSGMDWEEAIWAPRWVHGRVDVGESLNSIRYESRMEAERIRALSEEGETLPVTAWDELLGHAHVISVRDSGNAAFAVADPRSDGSVGIP